MTKQIISPSPVHLSLLIYKTVTAYKLHKAEWHNDHVWQSVGNCEWGIHVSHHQHDEHTRYTEPCFQSIAMVSFSSQMTLSRNSHASSQSRDGRRDLLGTSFFRRDLKIILKLSSESPCVWREVSVSTVLPSLSPGKAAMETAQESRDLREQRPSLAESRRKVRPGVRHCLWLLLFSH